MNTLKAYLSNYTCLWNSEKYAIYSILPVLSLVFIQKSMSKVHELRVKLCEIVNKIFKICFHFINALLYETINEGWLIYPYKETFGNVKMKFKSSENIYT